MVRLRKSVEAALGEMAEIISRTLGRDRRKSKPVAIAYFGPVAAAAAGSPPPTMALTDLGKLLREGEECLDNGGRMITGTDGEFGCYNESEGICYPIGEVD